MHLGELIKQKTYEHPVFHLRAHPFIFLKDIVVFVLLAAAPFAVYQAAKATYPTFFDEPTAHLLITLGASAYYLAIWLFLFSEFVDYYLDVWIVTNDRIVNVEQQGLFGRTISELDLYKVQDVTSEVKGMVPTFFNYGDVYIQTAGEKERFIFENVPNAHAIRKATIDLVAEDRKFHVKEELTEAVVDGTA